MNLRVRATKAVYWTATRSAATLGSRFIVMLLAAHLLAPLDIGLYAIANLVLGFAYILANGGLTQGVISKPDVHPDQLSSLFWFNLLSGAVLTLAVALAAPLLAEFYGQPRLLDMLLVTALNLLVAPFGQMSQALLQKHLDFASLARVDITVALLSSLCAVGMLYAGAGVYALIVSQVLGTVLRGIFLRICCRDLLPIQLRFRYAEIRSIVHFGIFQTGSAFLNYFSSRIDQFLIGTLGGPQALGYYSLAWNLIIEPVFRVSLVITSVAFPVFAKRQDDIGALRRGFRVVTKLLATGIAPLVFGFAAIASNAIPLVLGARWAPSIPLVQLLSIVAIVRTINIPVGSLVLAVGRADKLFYWTLGYCVLQPPLYAAFLVMGGLIPATLFLCAVNVAAMFLAYGLLLRPALGPIFADYMGAFLPSTVLAASMAIAVQSLSMIETAPTSTLLAAQVCLGIIIYGGTMMLFRRGDVSQIASLIASRG